MRDTIDVKLATWRIGLSGENPANARSVCFVSEERAGNGETVRTVGFDL